MVGVQGTQKVVAVNWGFFKRRLGLLLTVLGLIQGRFRVDP